MPGDSFLRGKSSFAPARFSFFLRFPPAALPRSSSSWRREETRFLSLPPRSIAISKCQRETRTPAHLPATTPHGCSMLSLSLSFFDSTHVVHHLLSSPLFSPFILTSPVLAFPDVLLSFSSLLARRFVCRSSLSYSETSSSISSHNRCHSRLYRLTRHPLFRVQRTVYLAAS